MVTIIDHCRLFNIAPPTIFEYQRNICETTRHEPIINTYTYFIIGDRDEQLYQFK